MTSTGFVAGEDDPVTWRGPLVGGFITQLFGDVEWGALDYLVDMPPGTPSSRWSSTSRSPAPSS